MLTIPAMEVHQGNTRLYLTSIRGADLRNWMEPSSGQSMIRADIWNKDARPEGYQREPSQTRIKGIAEFLLGKRGVSNPIMPQSIVLNLRTSRFSFEALSEDGRFGLLKIQDEAGPLFEVDGQHRLRGLCEAINRNPRMEDYPLLVTVTTDIPAPDEALQFVAINTTQVKVKPDLVTRILWTHYRDKAKAAEMFLKGDIWKIKAVDIVDVLNRDPDSPFHFAIAPPSAPGRLSRERLTTEAQFVDSLEPFDRHDRLFDDKFIGELWKAITSVYFPRAPHERRRDYLILQRVGLYVFHKVGPFLAYYTQSKYGASGYAELMKALDSVKSDFPLSFWLKGGRARNYNSRSGYNELADQICWRLVGCKRPRTRVGRLGKYLADETSKATKLRLFREFDKENAKRSVEAGSAGVYVLLNLSSVRAYVGFSGSGEKKDLRSRILDHLGEHYDVFNHRVRQSSRPASLLERSAWHDLRESGWSMDNRHPERRGYEECPVCGS